ncbi:hypothetical protein CASFOL_003170 [Castilleja foliolosa]|uniref:WIYLD domain-containing protein n=1 Tax=Castilleja foliolosa TaxID=1961234 RepID=A0ABD3EGY0_9LAMI
MPRGRPRKRLSRMDAAVDAMVPFGFLANKVEKHVNQLLEVYGGHEGWPFIEEYSYKELIDALLRDVEEGDEEEGQVEKLLEDESGAKNIITDEGPETNNLEKNAEPKSPEIASSSSGTNYVRQNSEDPKLHLPNGCPPRRRVHCYGWIDSDDENDADDFLVLKRLPGAFGPKADVPREDSKVLSDENKTRERRQRSRWDMKPDDLH